MKGQSWRTPLLEHNFNTARSSEHQFNSTLVDINISKVPRRITMDSSMNINNEPLEILELMDEFKRKVRKHNHVQFLDVGGHIQEVQLISGLMRRARGHWYNCKNMETGKVFAIDLKQKEGKIWITYNPEDPPTNLPDLKTYYGSNKPTEELIESSVNISHVPLADPGNSSDEEYLDDHSEFEVPLTRFKNAPTIQGFIAKKTILELFTSGEVLLDKAISYVSAIGRGQKVGIEEWIKELKDDLRKLSNQFDEVLTGLNNVRQQENPEGLDDTVLKILEAKNYITEGVKGRIKKMDLVLADIQKDTSIMQLTCIQGKSSESHELPPLPLSDDSSDEDSDSDSMETRELIQITTLKEKIADSLRSQAKCEAERKLAETNIQFIETIQDLYKKELIKSQTEKERIQEILEERIECMKQSFGKELKEFSAESRKEKQQIEERLEIENNKKLSSLKQSFEEQKVEAKSEFEQQMVELRTKLQRDYEEKLQACNEEIEEHTKEISDLQDKVKIFKDQLVESKKEVRELTKKKERFREESTGRLMDKVQDLESQLRDAEENISILREELQAANEEEGDLLLKLEQTETQNKENVSIIRDLKKKLSQKEKESDQIQHDESLIDLSGTTEDYTKDDLLHTEHLCTTSKDDQTALLLRRAKMQIDKDQDIEISLHNLRKIPNKGLIKLYKSCHKEGEESLGENRNKLMTELSKEAASPRLKPLVKYAFGSLLKYDTSLFSVGQQVAEEVTTRNINVDNPATGSNKEKYLTSPKFSGEVNADSYHFYEFWKHLLDYINSIDMDTETAPAMVKETITGQARAMVNRKFGDQTIPSMNELHDFLQSEFGREQSILDQIVKAHVALGKIENASTSTLMTRAHKHIDLYNRAIFLESRRPNLVYESESYKDCLHNHLFSSEYMRAVKIPLDSTNKQEIEMLRNEIDLKIKQLKNAEKTEIFVEEERKVTSSYPTSNQDTSSVRNDTEKKCKLCQHLLPLIGHPDDNLHKFSKFNNVEPDSCSHLRSKTLAEKDALLQSQNFCRRCLASPLSPHHTEDSCRPRSDWFTCAFSGCFIHQAVCVEHKDWNLRELKKRQTVLEELNLPQLI